MNARIRELLAFLYGEPRGSDAAAAVGALVAAARRGIVPRWPANARPGERDAILITYGDQVLAKGEPPLRTLVTFLAGKVAGAVSAVHILPFYPSSSDDGFSVMDYFTVDPALGTWEDVAALGRRFDLMFDAVFNHASVRGVWFQNFLAQKPGWETAFTTVEGDPDLTAVVRPRALPLLTEFATAAGAKRVWTTFSADQADINFADPRMLLRTLEALLFYVDRGARYIRLDAIAFLWKEAGTASIHLPQTHAVIRLMRAVLDEAAPAVQLITETNVPHQDNVSYFGDGTNEAQMVYNFALPPLVFHTLRTGDTTALCRWARTLATPGDRTTFFNFLASHDGIGLNPARGLLAQEQLDALVETALAHNGFVSWKHQPDGSRAPYELNVNYFDALSNPLAGEPESVQVARFLAAHAIMLALRGVPGIYFHSLFGSRGNRAAAESSGMPRRINRQKLHVEALAAELDSPDGLRSRVFAGISAMLRARASHPAFDPFAPQVIPDTPPALVAILRGSARRALCVVNVTNTTQRLDALGKFVHWRAIHGDAPESELPPYGTLWLSE
ncbi:MAG: sugar phosphorylase [Terrimicrobiaceae bacterium]|nr:sugar phosphorylase [Terrimicrobiaceae bacterium]